MIKVDSPEEVSDIFKYTLSVKKRRLHMNNVGRTSDGLNHNNKDACFL